MQSSAQPPAAAASPSRPTQGSPGRGFTRKIMASALLGALIFAGLALYSDLPKLQNAASHFAGSAFLWGLLLAAANYAIRIMRWQDYLRRLQVRVPLVESALIFLSGFVMSVTPGKVGEVFKSLLLHEARGVAIAKTAPIVIAERLTDLVALVLLTALGCLTFPSGPAIAAAGAAVVGFIVLLVSHRGLAEWFLALSARLPFIGKLAPRLREAYATLHELTRPGPMLMGTCLAFIAWGMECVSMYLIARGFDGVVLDLPAATFAYSASTIIGALAMMPGGLGVTEIGMTGLLQSLGGSGMTPAVASATTMLVRVATLWFAVGIGALALGLHRARYAPRRAASEGPEASPGDLP